MKCWHGCALAAVLATVSSPAYAAILTETFNDGAAAARWSVAVQTEATAAPSTGPDGSVDFAFDYSSLGIASPSGGDTIGAFIQVNKTDQTGDEGESYIIFPNGQSYSSPFAVEADMYVWNDGGAGTTELGMVGVYLDSADPVAPYQWGTRGGPLAWAYTGEGGSSADLAVFKEGNTTSTGYMALSDYNNVAAGSIPGFETGVSNSGGPAGTTASGAWVKVRIEAYGSGVRWYLNGALVDAYDNSGGFYSVGNIFFGATDPFNSVNAAGGTIIDNVVVTVPEPASAALACVGAFALMAIRRRG